MYLISFKFVLVNYLILNATAPAKVVSADVQVYSISVCSVSTLKSPLLLMFRCISVCSVSTLKSPLLLMFRCTVYQYV